ncbi:chemotaxis protein MotB [Nitrobacteraceae bacterium AZCC 1564]
MIVENEANAGAAAEEGENYFISMTDMMVGVLFIFIIMLMVFAHDFRSKTDVQEDAIKVAREVARKLDALQQQTRNEVAALDAARETRRQLLNDLRRELQRDGLDVEIDEVSGVLRLTEDAIRFRSDESLLLDPPLGTSRINVRRIARVLARVLPNYTACRVAPTPTGVLACRDRPGSTVETVFIEGHTDTTGIDERNWQLSTERAVNTYRELIASSPDLRTLRNQRHEEIISVSGYSSTRPIDPANSRAARDKNRRIDLRFVMEVDARERLREVLRLTDEMRGEIERLTNAAGGRR